VNTPYCLEEWRGEQRVHPQGITSPLVDKIHPWGSKFAPRGEDKNGPLGKLKTWIFFYPGVGRFATGVFKNATVFEGTVHFPSSDVRGKFVNFELVHGTGEPGARVHGPDTEDSAGMSGELNI
jgi:hypothetical protein